jgi:iron complex outermembrane recepter protein
MLNHFLFLIALGMLCAPTIVQASEARQSEMRSIELPNGTLSQILPVLGRQAGVSISVADGRLWQASVKSVRGQMTAEQALERMLAGSEARAVRVGATSWRIERRQLALKQPRRAAALPKKLQPPRVQAAPDPAIAEAPVEIVVSASKTSLPYSNFAGVASILDGDDLTFGGERGMDSILSRMASISSTHLGSGRNKLFIRGIADSSFTGPTQATVGQYLGDIRLSYNAPDPDLRLYDIDRVEVLEGPQGTLYGAGSLGGIIRIKPKSPDPGAFGLEAIAGASLTQHGEPGGDLAAIANLPVGSRGHALRVVGYTISDGGYIDNPRRGQSDVNRTNISGGRANLRLDLGDRWTADVGGIYQVISADDAQYADKNAPPLTRNSLVEQGAKAHYGSAMLVVAKDWDDLHFQSSNAYIDHHLDERFDASLAGDPPRVFDQENATRMFTSETRLSRPYQGGFGWVLGTSFVDNRTRQTRSFGAVSLRSAVTGVTNTVTEYTFYGEAVIELLPDVVATGGLRFTHARLGGQGENVMPLVAAVGQEITAHRNQQDILPSFSLLANPLPNFTLYARYQEGFRPGGLAIDGNFVRRFRNDHVATYEAGVRFGKKGISPFDAAISVSHSRWRNIQADFIDANGFPTTANIGDGRITSVSGSLAVRPAQGLSLELAAIYNRSRVDELSPELAVVPLARLGRVPNVASHALRGGIDYAAPLGDQDLRLNGWASYVGPSRLGIGPVLGEGQGDYVDTGIAMRIGNVRRGFSLTLTNLLDAKGNRFSLGTPFVEGGAGYLTPLRPRTIRLAVDVAY